MGRALHHGDCLTSGETLRLRLAIAASAHRGIGHHAAAQIQSIFFKSPPGRSIQVLKKGNEILDCLVHEFAGQKSKGKEREI
jgi:hypothetical protein